MNKSKLVRVLVSLKKKELKEFQQFLDSPFFNQREDLRALYQLIRQHIHKAQLMDKEALHLQLFPNQAFSKVNFDLLLSYLFRLLRQFLLHKEQQDHSLYNQLTLARAFRKRGLTKDFAQTAQQLKQQLEQQALRNAEYFHFTYQLQWEEHLELSARQPSEESSLQRMNDTIDLSYFALKLRHACLLVAHRNVYQSDHQIGFLPKILHHIQTNNLLTHPTIGLYYYCYSMLTQTDQETYFLQFKQLLFTQGHCFPESEIRDLYLLATNYCVRQSNQGQTDYIQQLFELYREGLGKGYLLEGGTLSRFTFHNAVATGLRTHQLQWTEDFIEQYHGTLEKKYRESSYSFNRARLEYSRQHYDAALLLLQKSNYRDLLLNLAAKTLQLKIYFELEEDNLLYSLLDAMQSYIRRKKITGYYKTNYLNIINYTRKLLAVRPYDQDELMQLRQGIEKEKILTERDWLLERVREM